jgi:predicted amidohydrolase YtcJ
MDVALRSYARARAQRLRRHRGPTVRPEREARTPDDRHPLLRGRNSAPEGRPQLAITSCTLAGREGRFTVSLRDGVIQAVEPAGAQVDAEQVRDARGGLLLPGFTDSHVHLLVGAERLDGCDVGDVRDAAELELRIRRFAEENPDRPMIQVHGLNYLEPPLLDPARARSRLDEIVSDRPLIVVAHDLHTVWANTRALEESGLLRAMPPYPREIVEVGAEAGIGLDGQGLPGGELREPECYCLVEGAIRALHPLKQEQKLASLRRAAAELNRHGITSVHNMGLAMPEEDVELLLLLLELEEKEELTIRVESSYSVVPDEHMLEDVHDAAEIRDRLRRYREGALTVSDMHRFLVGRLEALAKARRLESEFVANHDEVARIHVQPHLEGLEKRLREARSRTAATQGMVTLDAVKLFLDGVVEKETAYRTDRPPQNGLPSFPPEDLEETVRIADRLGLQVRAHCIGDKSVSLMLDAISAARRANAQPDERRGHRIRHRIEHVEMCRPEDLVRFQSEDTVASMQPFHERPPLTLWHKLVPESEWGTAFPWKSLSEEGAAPVFGSDWPIVSCDCLGAARHAATRTPWRPGLPEQGLSIEEALAGFTSGPPRAVHRENELGAVEPGMLADLVLLTPGALLPEDGARVCLTICAGRIVYES